MCTEMLIVVAPDSEMTIDKSQDSGVAREEEETWVLASSVTLDW